MTTYRRRLLSHEGAGYEFLEVEEGKIVRHSIEFDLVTGLFGDDIPLRAPGTPISEQSLKAEGFRASKGWRGIYATFLGKKQE